MNPFRTVDEVHRRQAVLREAQRIRDALAADHTFYNIARGNIRSSQEIVDAITGLLELTK